MYQTFLIQALHFPKSKQKKSSFSFNTRTKNIDFLFSLLFFYLHLPGKSVINGHDCHGSNTKARHHSRDQISESFRFLPLRFLETLRRRQVLSRANAFRFVVHGRALFPIVNDETDGEELALFESVESERRREDGGGQSVIVVGVRGGERSAEWFECYGD